MPANVAQRLVETLIVNGVTHVFCVPGESYLAVLDALVDVRDRIQVITCRHEAAAANMAVAYGKLTGRPGVCFVTRGPGATHASIGVHTASQDSVPMILFIGQIATSDVGREAFQEVDYSHMFGAMTKLVLELRQPERTVESITRALATASAGRMGPVIVSLPEDVLTADAGTRVPAPVRITPAALDPDITREIGARLNKAERPLVLLGGSGWTAESLATISGWARTHDLPLVLSWRRKDLIDNDHPCYVGDLNIRPMPSLNQRIQQSDLLLVIGTRLGDVPTGGYTLLSTEDAARKLIHIYPAAEELQRVWQPSLAAVAHVTAAAYALSQLKLERRWTDWCRGARAEYERTLQPVETAGAVNPSHIFRQLNELLPVDAIVTNGAGNYATWPNRFFRYRGYPSQLAPTSGAMGFGFPAAIAAKLLYPQRDVIALAGDGCFLMTGQELATAVQYNVNVITLIFDNGSYGTIRMHQERDYPGRVSATDLRNPDFVAYAQAFGAWAARVERTDDFVPALDAARKAGRPAVLHIRTDVEDILPGQRLTKRN